MVIAFGFLDRALDLIGLATVIYWTVKGTLWAARRNRKAGGTE